MTIIEAKKKKCIFFFIAHPSTDFTSTSLNNDVKCFACFLESHSNLEFYMTKINNNQFSIHHKFIMYKSFFFSS